MTLPFLTADRVFDEVTADAPVPYDTRDGWRRPYRPGAWRVAGAALALLLASYMLFAAVIIAMAGTLPGAGLCTAAAVVVIALALRLLRMGAWVSRDGLRRVGLLTTTTLAWEQVASVRVVQQPVKWLGMPRTVQGQALVAVPHGSEPLRPLITDHNADFLSRTEAFDRAADTIEAWATEHCR